MPSKNDRLLIFLFYAGVIFFWYLLSWSVGKQNLPPPHSVLQSVFDGLIHKDFFLSSLSSFLRAIFGFLLSAGAGIACGVMLSQLEALAKVTEKFFHTLQILPNIVWVPVAFVWFGPSELSIFLILFVVGFLSVASHTLYGLRNVPKNLIDAALTMGEKGLGLYTHIKIPASIPAILIGFKLGWIFVWRSLITAELVYATKGVGLLLNRSKDAKNIEEMFAVIVIIFVFGLLTEFLFGKIESNFRKRYGFS